MVRHSFTFDFIPLGYDDTKAMFTVKHIPVEHGNWGEVTRLMEMTVSIGLKDIEPAGLLPVAAALALRAAHELQMALTEVQAPERK